MVKLLLHYRASAGFRAMLEEAAPTGIELVVVGEADTELLARELPDTDVLLHVLEPVTAAMIASGPRLKLIQKIGVGVNTIDLDTADAAGIAVANMPGTNSRAVAEMALTLMLAVLRRVTYLDPLTRSGRGWEPDLALMDGVGEIAGRTIGLVGFGAVPRLLAPILDAMGADILFTARSPQKSEHASQVDLDTLLERSDIVSLHVPLTDETTQMIDGGAIEKMKPGAIIINTARGPLIDEEALVNALESGRLRGAGLDVFGEEPVDPQHRMLALPNIVVMPHMAWLTPETLRRSLVMAFENSRRIAAGEELLHRVG
ncbi:NAD(P)-dependent oxidoreductase [Parasphingopyxis lamellibrachiae]|uniref:Phosphoglycerate dehydrogenase-like enzyme n=1 Tax=Parasphingopyxis lamellibrachiae TaxID=680125 RepID=A0A3D9FJT6_9SPHN|nr:2-hydroxyacid dehydrogenase [Parasphingopyxis lamellibrachiae]RED17351.1 phosphoglycerate dehydrogenase-like enzyme [Parasphingopyxis lamellibrachiae]